MKNKWLIALIIFVGIFLIVLMLARVTGVLQIFTIPTASNEPTIAIGSIIFTSSLKQPKNGDFISFKSSPFSDSIYATDKKGATYISRLIGTEGQVVEMKDGTCFVNGKNIDSNKNLLQTYIVNEKELKTIPNIEKLQKKNHIIQMGEKSFYIFFTSKEVADMTKNGHVLEKLIFKKGVSDDVSFEWMNNDSGWSIDNFGPLTIPKGFFFVLGDNRHNSLDSRFVGFIKKENFRGTVLNK